MKRLTGLLTLVAGIFAAGGVLAAIDIEPWLYPKGPATPTAGAYPSTLHILAVPGTSVGSTVHIPGDVFVTLTGTQTITGKTFTAPIFGGTITGTYTLGGTPTIPTSGLSGNLPIANFNSGTGASATTLWHGNGTWGAVALGTDVSGTLAIANGGTGANTVALARTGLGLGSAAVENIGTSGTTLGLLNGNLTFSGNDTFSLAPTITAFGGSGARCVEASNSGLLTLAAAACGTGGGGGGPAVEYVGDATGTNTYVASSVTPSGFSPLQNYRFCGFFANANTGPSTLNVLSSGAFSINTQGSAGLAPLVKGEIGPNSRLCFQLASATGPWVMQTLPFGHVTVPAAGTTVVTGPQWASGETFDIKVAGVTLSIPPANTLPPNGGIVIKTTGVTATVTPDSGDGIKTGVGPSTPGIAAPIPEGALSLLTSTGVAGVDAFTLPSGPVQYYALTWGPAQNLATVPIPIGGFQTPRIITGVNCVIAAVTGGTSTLDVWAADYSVTAANVTTSGTKLNGATPCNANTLSGVPGSFQGLTVASASVAANSQLWLVATGSAWSASTGVGKFQVGYK